PVVAQAADPSVVHHYTQKNSGGSTSITVTISVAPAAGNLLVVKVSCNGTGVSDPGFKTDGSNPTGYSAGRTFSNGTSGVFGQVYYKTAAGSETSVVITPTGSGCDGYDWYATYDEVDNMATSSQRDGGNHGSGNG